MQNKIKYSFFTFRPKKNQNIDCRTCFSGNLVTTIFGRKYESVRNAKKTEYFSDSSVSDDEARKKKNDDNKQKASNETTTEQNYVIAVRKQLVTELFDTTNKTHNQITN